LYRRTDSYFARSELAAAGKPASAQEQELLRPFPDAVRPEIVAGNVGLRTAESAGEARAGLAAAMRLLQEANYRLEGRLLANATTHQPLAFEFLAISRAQERLMLTFAERLRRAGVTVRIRQVDNAQYWARLKSFDFDMIQWLWPSSLSPGNEQVNRWSSVAADTEGSLNYAGVKSLAADAMIKAMLEAESREGFGAAVRAFDRVLLSGDYVIPLFYAPGQWIAYWDRLGMPDKVPLAGMDVDRWWLKR
jgi:peptide/nickel transport system substrate-binding protein